MPWPDPVDLLGRRLDELDDQETRLLAVGIGDHTPHEIIVNVELLHVERARLLALNVIGEGALRAWA
ncbi:MAG: hypothetical protein ABI427_07100 [Solirubrobacteraceae bacterium]